MLLNNENIMLNAKIENLTTKLTGLTTQLCDSKSQLNAVSIKLEHLQQKLQKTTEDQIASMVGIDKWFNTDNIHKNEVIIKTGGANFRKTWALMDSNNILYIDDYPLLFEVLKAEDRGDGTFAMPDFYDGTLRHIRYGDARELGSFEDDSMESHVHSNTHGHTSNPHSHTSNPHDHDMSHQHNYKGTYSLGNNPGPAGNGNYWSISETTGGRDRTNQQAVAINSATVTINNTTITTDTGTGKQATETRMKNTAGQWYILAKVTYIS